MEFFPYEILNKQPTKLSLNEDDFRRYSFVTETVANGILEKSIGINDDRELSEDDFPPEHYFVFSKLFGRILLMKLYLNPYRAEYLGELMRELLEEIRQFSTDEFLVQRHVELEKFKDEYVETEKLIKKKITVQNHDKLLSFSRHYRQFILAQHNTEHQGQIHGLRRKRCFQYRKEKKMKEHLLDVNQEIDAVSTSTTSVSEKKVEWNEEEETIANSSTSTMGEYLENRENYENISNYKFVPDHSQFLSMYWSQEKVLRFLKKFRSLFISKKNNKLVSQLEIVREQLNLSSLHLFRRVHGITEENVTVNELDENWKKLLLKNFENISIISRFRLNKLKNFTNVQLNRWQNDGRININSAHLVRHPFSFSTPLERLLFILHYHHLHQTNGKDDYLKRLKLNGNILSTYIDRHSLDTSDQNDLMKFRINRPTFIIPWFNIIRINNNNNNKNKFDFLTRSPHENQHYTPILTDETVIDYQKLFEYLNWLLRQTTNLNNCQIDKCPELKENEWLLLCEMTGEMMFDGNQQFLVGEDHLLRRLYRESEVTDESIQLNEIAIRPKFPKTVQAKLSIPQHQLTRINEERVRRMEMEVSQTSTEEIRKKSFSIRITKCESKISVIPSNIDSNPHLITDVEFNSYFNEDWNEDEEISHYSSSDEDELEEIKTYNPQSSIDPTIRRISLSNFIRSTDPSFLQRFEESNTGNSRNRKEDEEEGNSRIFSQHEQYQQVFDLMVEHFQKIKF
ncbi:hypothetical protein SNEBB_002638 [Seison nebaliae]|nr:hypothetical protein SNEBB_002638 [Seison nebaliae]